MVQIKYFKTLNVQAQIKHVNLVETYLNKRLSSAATGARKAFYQKLINANFKRIDGPAAFKSGPSADGKAREMGGSEKSTAGDGHGDDVLGIFNFD